MPDPDRVRSFEQTVLPHLRAGYNLARWIVRNDHDAEDVLQESILRAYRSFDGFSSGNPRTWLMTVVRNHSYTFLRKNRSRDLDDELDEDSAATADTPEVVLLRSAQGRFLNEAVAALPVAYREAFVLRELEGLSYKEIADMTDVPIGTVMSRLSRARQRLQAAVLRRERERSGS